MFDECRASAVLSGHRQQNLAAPRAHPPPNPNVRTVRGFLRLNSHTDLVEPGSGDLGMFTRNVVTALGSQGTFGLSEKRHAAFITDPAEGIPSPVPLTLGLSYHQEAVRQRMEQAISLSLVRNGCEALRKGGPSAFNFLAAAGLPCGGISLLSPDSLASVSTGSGPADGLPKPALERTGPLDCPGFCSAASREWPELKTTFLSGAMV